MNPILVALLLLIPYQAGAAAKVTIDPQDEKWVISKYLIGMHAVYTTEPDAVYEDDSLAHWAKKVGVGVFRYPGGTVLHHWNWEKPSGTWSWTGSAPEKDWMSLDEYLHFCKVSGATPLVGVNYNHYYQTNEVDRSATSAAGLVKYVKDAGFPGAFYYIGNELDRVLGPAHKGLGGIKNAGPVFVKHSKAMKAVDPDIKVLYNWNFETPASLKEWMALVGDAADGVDFHEKWPDERTEGSYEMWKKEVPLVWNYPPDKLKNIGLNKAPTWRERIEMLRKAAAEIGRPDMLMTNIEYGIGPDNTGFNRFTMSLMLIDYLQELFIAGYDMGSHWSNTRAKFDDGMLLNAGNKWRMNPVGYGWEFLGRAQGKTMIGFEADNKFVYGFAAKDSSGEYQVYLMNKTESVQPLSLSFKGSPADMASWTSSAKTLMDGDGHWGLVNNLDITFNASTQLFQATLPAMSYNQILFKKENSSAINASSGLSQSQGGIFLVSKAGKIIIEAPSSSKVTLTTLAGKVVFEKYLKEAGSLEIGKESVARGFYNVNVVSGSQSVSEKSVWIK